MSKNIDEMSFEECLEELEAKVKELEAGNKDLDESLKIYEQAIELRKKCREFLDQSERRVQALMEKAGEIEKKDFNL